MGQKPGIVTRFFQLFYRPGGLSTDSFTIFLTDTVVMAIGMAGSILIARLFGPEGRGIITMVTLIPLTLFYLGSLGLPDSSTYFLSRFREQARENFFTIQALAWVAGLITIAAAYLSFEWWYQPYKTYPRELFLIVIPTSLAAILTLTLRYSLLGLGSSWGFNLMNVVQALGSLTTIVIAGVFLHRDLRWFCYIYLIYPFVVVALGMGLVGSKPEIRGWPAGLNLRPVMSYAMRTYPQGIVFWLQSRLDHFLIAYFLEPAQLGIYSIAIFLSENLLRITAAFQTALFPRVSADQTDAKYLLAARVLRVTNMIDILLSIGIIALGYPIIRLLFGKEFAPAYLPLVVLVIGRIPAGLYKIASSTIAGSGRPGLLSLFGTIGIVVNAGLGLLLIPSLGLLGASLAKTISVFAQLIPAMIFFASQAKLGWTQCLVMNREDWRLIKAKAVSWLAQS